jgi:hypothetical protein
MRNIRRRLRLLERLPKRQPPPNPLEQIMRVAVQSLSDQDLELLRLRAMGQSESSDREAAAVLAWEKALELEARRMGFRSFAEAQRTFGQRP